MKWTFISNFRDDTEVWQVVAEDIDNALLEYIDYVQQESDYLSSENFDMYPDRLLKMEKLSNVWNFISNTVDDSELLYVTIVLTI